MSLKPTFAGSGYTLEDRVGILGESGEEKLASEFIKIFSVSAILILSIILIIIFSVRYYKNRDRTSAIVLASASLMLGAIILVVNFTLSLIFGIDYGSYIIPALAIISIIIFSVKYYKNKEKLDKLAFAALVMGLIGISGNLDIFRVFSLAAIAISILAFRSIKRNKKSGTIWTVFGLVLGILRIIKGIMPLLPYGFFSFLLP